MKRLKPNFLSPVAAAVLATTLACNQVAYGQDDSNDSVIFLEEIIVTAQKRAESLQDVPIAVTALTSSDLEALRLENAVDIQFNTPNLLINRNSNYTIRGVGQLLFGSSSDPGVGIVRDGVYAQAAAATSEVYDLERIEVLRGPQGTLFGRNTTGGAIHFISKKAESEFGGYVEAQVENNNGFRGTAVVNFPLSENVHQRIAANAVKRDGYTENLFTGNDIDGRDSQSLRSSTSFKFENTTADLVINYYQEDSNRGNSPKALCLPDPDFICSSEGLDNQYPLVNYPLDNFAFVGATGSGVRADRFLENPEDLRQVNIDVEPVYDGNELFASFEVNHFFGDLTFTSVTGYAETELDTLRDFDLGAAPFGFNPGSFANFVLGGVPVELADDGQGNGVLTYLEGGVPVTTTRYSTTQTSFSETQQFSQEFRLASNFDSALNFTLGLYYLDYETTGGVTTYLPVGLARAGIEIFTPESLLESTAIFGETYWQVTDSLKITAGLRYTDEEKEITTGIGNFSAVENFNSAQADFSESTGRLALAWEANNNTLVYGSFARGYKSGGFNVGNQEEPTYEPEFVDTLEVGVKAQLLDNRLQLNAALFNSDYQELGLGLIVGTAVINTNVPESTIRGAELEMVYLPSGNWRVEAGVGLMDSEIESDFVSGDAARGFATFNLKGNELPNTPGSTVKLALQNTFELANGWTVTPRIDYYWQDDFYVRQFNTGADLVDSWEQIDASMVLLNSDSNWSLTAFVKNISDEDSITHIETNSELVGSFKNIFLLEPRTIGLAAKYEFN